MIDGLPLFACVVSILDVALFAVRLENEALREAVTGIHIQANTLNKGMKHDRHAGDWFF
jgi:hypothetical protein